MTWAWPIFFSLLLCAPADAAAVSGHVRLADSAVPAVRKRHDYSGAVVWLEPLAPVPVSARPRHAKVEQKDKRFVPHILAVQAGTDVSFPNMDPIYHSAFSNFSGQIFDLGLYAPGADRTITFRRTGVVRIFCNIHPTMSAVIVVLKYPWFAVTGANGAFVILDVPLGEYRLHVFHERATSETLRGLERKVTVDAGGLALPLVAISETGYVATPHKNKYGHDYPTGTEERAGYPGDR